MNLNTDVPAIVIGGGVNGLGVLRSLAGAGVDVTLIGAASNEPAMLSRYGRKILQPSADPQGVFAALEQLLADPRYERSVLILTQEETVAAATEHFSWLQQHFRLTLPAPEYLAPMLNKHEIERVANQVGARVPRTLRVRAAHDLGDVEQLKLPVIVKPAAQNEAYIRSFKKAYRLASYDEVRALVTDILTVMLDVVVQEWIEGSDSDIYFCLQYLPPDNDQVVSFTGRKVRSWPPRVGGTARCTPAPEAAELAALTTRFFRAAGITGLASMEYKRNQNSGDYVIVEPTVGRTDFQEEVATLNGVNLPLAAYCDLTDQTLPEQSSPRNVHVWRERTADIMSELKSDASETRHPSGARVVNALWRWHDPGPALEPLARRIRTRIKRIVSRRAPADKRS